MTGYRAAKISPKNQQHMTLSLRAKMSWAPAEGLDRSNNSMNRLGKFYRAVVFILIEYT